MWETLRLPTQVMKRAIEFSSGLLEKGKPLLLRDDVFKASSFFSGQLGWQQLTCPVWFSAKCVLQSIQGYGPQWPKDLNMIVVSIVPGGFRNLKRSSAAGVSQSQPLRFSTLPPGTLVFSGKMVHCTHIITHTHIYIYIYIFDYICYFLYK